MAGKSLPKKGGPSTSRRTQTPTGQTPVGVVRVVRPGLRASGALAWAPLAQKYGKTYGIPPEVFLAALAAESGGNPNAVGDSGHSVGLFQLHDRGAGYGLSVSQRQDPDTQFRVMGPRFADAYRAAVARGKTGQAALLDAIAYAERPAGYDVEGSAARARYAAKLAEFTGYTSAAAEAIAADGPSAGLVTSGGYTAAANFPGKVLPGEAPAATPAGRAVIAARAGVVAGTAAAGATAAPASDTVSIVKGKILGQEVGLGIPKSILRNAAALSVGTGLVIIGVLLIVVRAARSPQGQAVIRGAVDAAKAASMAA